MFRIVCVILLAATMLAGCGNEGEFQQPISPTTGIAAAPSQSHDLFTPNVFYFAHRGSMHTAEKTQRIYESLRTARNLFAHAMSQHEFGSRTFKIPRDSRGNILVHKVVLEHPVQDYYADKELLPNEVHQSKLSGDLQGSLNGMPNIFFFDLPEYPYGACASAGTTDARMRRCWNGTTLAHELGHVMGLKHEFGDPTNIMGASWFGIIQNNLSKEAARWVNYHSDAKYPHHAKLVLGRVPKFNQQSRTIAITYLHSYGENVPQEWLHGYTHEDTLGFDYALLYAVYYNGSKYPALGFTDKLVYKGLTKEPMGVGRVDTLATYELSLEGLNIPEDISVVDIKLIGRHGHQASAYFIQENLGEN